MLDKLLIVQNVRIASNKLKVFHFLTNFTETNLYDISILFNLNKKEKHKSLAHNFSLVDFLRSNIFYCNLEISFSETSKRLY